MGTRERGLVEFFDVVVNINECWLEFGGMLSWKPQGHRFIVICVATNILDV